MNSTKCEFCTASAIAEVLVSDINTAFTVCAGCQSVIDQLRKSGSFVPFDSVPQDELIPGECGGWDTSEHMTEGGELVYVLVNDDGPISQENVMIFCRSCFGEYVNSEK